LIFTPKNLPVGGLFVNDTPKDGTWALTYKWKPPEYNSIDFQIEIIEDDYILEDSQIYKLCNLYVGNTSDNNDEFLDPLTYKNSKPQNKYNLVKFPPSSTSYFMVNENKHMLCENGDMIENGMIVECMFNDNKWKPMRVRYDKVRPNFLSIAMSNWKSIQFPVTESIICGDESIEENTVLNEDELYYHRIYSRDKSATKSMLNFHNHWVKDISLLKRVSKNNSIDSLFDIACGRGNDLPRWMKYKVKTLLGIDINEDNILNAQDGAYARMFKCRNMDSVNYAFLTIDASKKIDTNLINSIENNSLRTIGNSVWGIEKDKRVLNTFNMANNKFDVITCNFAIHYFFTNEESLVNVCNNIARHINKNGYFIGTCFDENEIEKLLRPVRVGDEISCTKEGRVIWSITKMYDEISTFGSKIAVYIETIGKKNVEFLVDFNRLVQELEKYNIVLQETHTFQKLFGNMQKNTIDKNNKYLYGPDGAIHMSNEEKKLSFLNRYFIFKKVS